VRERYSLGSLARATQVAGVDGIQRDVREPVAEGCCLGPAAVGQGSVGMSLPTPGPVPIGLAVAGEQERRHAHILP
jgi:hypothetical protein